MREILFRGKMLKSGAWIEGDLRQYPSGAVAIKSNDFCHIIEVDPEAVGQYTGLTDKNGKRIFEGDILRGSWNTKLVVFYDDISTSYKVKTSAGMEKEISYYGLDRIEVIGNIHDNPELLEGKKGQI